MTNDEAIRYLDGIKPVGIHMEKDIYMLRGEALSMAISALENQRWIPCSERLPEDYINVMFYNISGYVFIGHYDMMNKCWDVDFCNLSLKCEKIVAWMPLPEPYHE